MECVFKRRSDTLHDPHAILLQGDFPRWSNFTLLLYTLMLMLCTSCALYKYNASLKRRLYSTIGVEPKSGITSSTVMSYN